MTTEIAVRDTDSWAPMLPAVRMLAEGVCNTEFVPKSLRGKEYAVAACVLAGREMGLGPMESLQKIYVVEGRPALSAELMRSLVLRAGHSIEFTTLTNQSVTIRGRRAGSDSWTEITWATSDAQRIGVAGKDVWKKYPRAMLANRATAELCRLIFPDALGGISITPDEIEDEATPATRITRAADGEAGTRKVSRAKTPDPVEPPLDDVPAVDVETGEIVDAEIVDEPEPTIPDEIPTVTPAQLKKLGAAFTSAGVTVRADRLAYVSAAIGRDVESSKDLSKSEASIVIDLLESAAPEPTFDDEPTLDGAE